MTQNLIEKAVIILALGLAGQALHAQSRSADHLDIHVRTIHGLKQRRLFDMATEHANHVLADETVSGRERIDVIVALIDTLAQRAYVSRDPQAWTDARNVAADWDQRSQSPRKILIPVQAALVDLLQVERWVREIETDSAKPETRNQALAEIAGLDNRFQQLQLEVRTLLNRRPGPREEAEWFLPNELLTLRYNLEYQQARALQYRAALYRKDQALDRKDVLTLVEKQLNSVLKSVGPDQRLWWSVQADRIAIARDSGDYRKASLIVQGLPKNDIDPANKSQITSEWIRTLSAAGKWSDAVTVAGKESFASAWPRLDLARVELFVAMAGRSDDQTWQQRALDLTRSIEQNHGGYWGRLANLAVVGTAALNPESGSNLGLLIRVADEAQRKKQWDQAVKALDAAYQTATESGQSDVAWKLGFRAASIEQTQGRNKNASERFEKLALRYSDLPQAHTGLLMACWNLTRVFKDDSANETRYISMLARLIETWPGSSSADQARIWLATFRKAEKNWPSAIGLLLDVNANSPLFGKAVTDLRDVTKIFMSQNDVSPESKINIRTALMVRLSPLLDVNSNVEANPGTGSLPENWNSAYAQIVISLAELKFLYGADIPAENLLTKLGGLSTNPTLSPDILAYVMALIRVGHIKFGGAPAEFQVNSDPALAEIQLDLFFAAFVSSNIGNEPNQHAEQLVNIVDASQKNIDRLPVAKKRAWRLAAIGAFQRSNQLDRAVQLATQLAEKDYPKDLAVQIRAAELFTTAAKQNAEFIDIALKQWRKLAKASRKNTRTWYTAKFHVAYFLSGKGGKEEALKLLRFIDAVPPGWKNASNADQFDELFRSLGGR